MTVFDPVSAIKTLLSNYSYLTVNSNVTGNPLTADVVVKTSFEERSSSVSFDNGVLLIDSAEGIPSKPHHESYRNERWIVNCRLIYKDDPSVLKAIFDEIDRVFESNNSNTANDEYLWEYKYNQDQVKGQYDLVLIINRIWILVSI